MLEMIADLWRHRDLIVSFARRDIKARYKQTVLGIAWAVLQPLSMMVVFTLVFSLFAKIPSDGLPYPIFAYSGLIFWTYFASAISGGTTTMVGNSSLIRKIHFPRATLLVAVLIAGSLDLLVSASLFLAMMAYYHVAVTLTALWALPLLVVQMLFALGVASLTSAAHVNFRDIGHGLPLLLQLWMFASPVAYPISVIPEWLLPFYLLNPMAPIIDGYRRALLHGVAPDLAAVGLSALAVTLFAILALSVFRRAERTFADVI
ncbi:MAG: ABC transporter permease [Candidatus Rokubacteria bacterium]|nr:ABC transporter permease [Candidatus Rokubacteria bacterium]